MAAVSFADGGSDRGSKEPPITARGRGGGGGKSVYETPPESKSQIPPMLSFIAQMAKPGQIFLCQMVDEMKKVSDMDARIPLSADFMAWLWVQLRLGILLWIFVMMQTQEFDARTVTWLWLSLTDSMDHVQQGQNLARLAVTW